MSPANFEIARRNMVEYQIRCCKVLDPALLDMIESLPREDFLPEDVRSLAYMEGHVPLPCGQEMLSPLQEATILQTLELTGSERILEIGSGCGFLTTMLAMSGGEVVSVEMHAELARLAGENLEKHGIGNATVIEGNAMDPAIAKTNEVKNPFDIIVLGASVKEVPEHVKAMLSEQGEIVAFIGTNPVVSLVHIERDGDVWQQSSIVETLLQDMEGLPDKREFVF